MERTCLASPAFGPELKGENKTTQRQQQKQKSTQPQQYTVLFFNLLVLSLAGCAHVDPCHAQVLNPKARTPLRPPGPARSRGLWQLPTC